MDWKNWFKIKVTRPCNIWPNTDSCRVKILIDVTLMDTERKNPPAEVGVGTSHTLHRIPNPFGFTDPWMVTEGKVVGAAERWWKDLIESGQAEVERVFD
ncbi:MAG: hypothetical protein UX47_C0004G0029 [Candidatus Collierbacteria bacterium GW2011_GWA2_46_26]|uniref:Uncharacterized protein n=1 Tax=Candidatus Collierbacteria bacterium GW2011_GWA2_46_26 TaxID=1618381 RepID=A0A0G1PKN9_9BACT|nr:MAG: hypothetical protein UX47_C0004G0029 [Candidatus Collierbacteria bacterium GW2011_GWA2_46_26]